MGLLTFLFRLPWLPVQGFVKLATVIKNKTDQKMASPATIRRELEQAEQARESKEMSDEQVDEFQDAALAEFTQAQRNTAAAPTHEG